MPVINRKVYTKDELLKRCGSMNQLAGCRRYAFTEGKAKGIEAADIDNGNGLRFTVLLDRCLDIAGCSFRGINLSFISGNGIVAPWYYESQGNGWLRSFTGGLLATCGISYSGASCEDEGERLGLHGRIGNSPADNICCETFWEGEDYKIRVKGSASEARLFGEKLVLTREIVVTAGENKIHIHDSIENMGHGKSPIMMIYHMNLGFPLLDEGCQVHMDAAECIPNNIDAELKMGERFQITGPQHGISENVYFYRIKEKDKMGTAAVINRNLDSELAGVYIKFNIDELPYLNQWKMMGEGEYALGIEPSNCRTLGRAHERQEGTLRYIEPGEIKDFIIEFGIIEDINQLISVKGGITGEIK